MKTFWDFNSFFEPSVGKEFQVSLQEGSTPLYPFSDFLSTREASVFLKYERANPTGTHKDRSMAYWFSRVKSLGIREAVISSSGNSAISAARYAREAGSIMLRIFVSSLMNEEKKMRLLPLVDGERVVMHESRAPKRDAFRYAQEQNAYFLRSSTDELAVQGYKTIAYEIAEQHPSCDAVFVSVSSGATLTGIYQGFKDLNTPSLPRFFAVQTAAVHPIVDGYDADFLPEDSSLATSIVDRVAHRKKEVRAMIEATGGSGVVISDQDLLRVKERVKSDVVLGWESLMTLAALLKVEKKYVFKNVVCVCTS